MKKIFTYRVFWWAAMFVIFTLGFILLGLLGSSGYRYRYFNFEAFSPDKMKNILTTIGFWVTLILPSIIMGEAVRIYVSRKFRKHFGVEDPLDELIKESSQNSNNTKRERNG